MYNFPAYNQFQFDRAQQINELLVSIQACRAVNPDRSLLEVPVRLSNGVAIALRISVPPGFPQEKPVLSVASPVRHPWVDAIGRLSFPTLDRWSGSTMRLAAVVSEAMQGLASGTGSGQAGQPGPPQQPGRPQQAGGAQQQQAGSGPPPPAAVPQRPRLPPPRTEFPELEQLSNADLLQALTNEEVYAEVLKRALATPAAASDGQQASEVVRQLRSSVEEAARRNLAREQEMAEVRNQMAIIRSSEYAPARAAYDEKSQRQQKVLQLLSPKVLVERLQAAAAQAEAESEALYKRFQEGQLGAEAFVEQYTAARAVYHQRDLKAQAAVHTIPMLDP